jgi:hypothetical protein
LIFLSLHNLGLDFFEDIFDYNIHWHCNCIFSFLGLHIYMDASLNGTYDFAKFYIKKHILNCSLKMDLQKRSKHVADLIIFYIIKVV